MIEIESENQMKMRKNLEKIVELLPNVVFVLSGIVYYTQLEGG
ncbi:hypothetical protein [Caproicibacterium sp. BJN0003]|nr:hypothetical protein [Caproicibacterium sp. BJN0003]UZT82853.1 hypothetical protein OP489_03315 [Caproicibacterium sp. BJN0003]